VCAGAHAKAAGLQVSMGGPGGARLLNNGFNIFGQACSGATPAGVAPGDRQVAPALFSVGLTVVVLGGDSCEAIGSRLAAGFVPGRLVGPGPEIDAAMVLCWSAVARDHRRERSTPIEGEIPCCRLGSRTADGREAAPMNPARLFSSPTAGATWIGCAGAADLR